MHCLYCTALHCHVEIFWRMTLYYEVTLSISISISLPSLVVTNLNQTIVE